MPTKITNQTNTQCSVADCIETAADGVTQRAGGDTFSQCDCANALANPSAAGGAANIAKLFAVSAGVIGLAALSKVTGGKQGQGRLAKRINDIVEARIKAGDSPEDVDILKRSLEFAAMTPELAECPEGAILSDLVLGDLSPRDAVAVAGHAASCPECLALVQAMKELLETPNIEPKENKAGRLLKEKAKRPGRPERPTAIGREHGRDGVDGKGPGRDKDAEGRKGPEGRRGRGPVK